MEKSRALYYGILLDFEAKVGVESNGYQEQGIKILEQEAKKAAVYLPIARIKNQGEKLRRIQTLEPLITNGTLKLCADHMLLNEQLQLFPNAKYDDGPDALEMCVRLAEAPRIAKVSIVGPMDDWYGDYQRNLGFPPIF